MSFTIVFADVVFNGNIHQRADCLRPSTKQIPSIYINPSYHVEYGPDNHFDR